ncbi:MAG: LysR family transcriptional regulator [Caldimonas sp.]
MTDIERLERRISLHDLRVLMSVVQAGSMGKAAKRLATSQPAVSRSMSDLEAALGVALLERSSKGVEPTSYGRALVKRGLVVFDELAQGVKDIQFLSDPTTGQLRIGASIAVAVSFVTSVIDRLSRRYPRMSFEVLATDTTTAYRALADREVDLLLAHMVEPIDASTMRAETLLRDPHVVAVGSRTPWARRRRLSLVDLMDEPWVLPPPDAPYGKVVYEAFRANGLGVPRTVVTSTLPVRAALLATGGYISMVPRVVVQLQSKPEVLKSLPIDLPTTDRPIALIALKNRPLSPMAEVFAALARETATTLGQ